MSRSVATFASPSALTPADRAPRLSWRAVVPAFTAIGVLRFTYFYLDDVTRLVHGTLVRRLIEEGTGAYAAMALFPFIAFAERRLPLNEGRWRRHWAWYVVIIAAYSAAHTSLMAVSRWTIFPALGLGPYDYGQMPTRYFMEAPEDLIGCCLVLGALTLLRVQQRLRDRDVQAAELARDAATARLEALSLRLQPHFLFNALNTISSIVYEDPVAADVMIGRLGDLLRQALRAGDQPEISLAAELDVLRAYLALVEARFGDRLVCTLDVDPAATACAVPAFLLQPLVENAVRHGASLESDNTQILVAVRRNVNGEAHGLEIVVENDAPAATHSAPAGSPPIAEATTSGSSGGTSGTGLRTTRDRLRLLYGDAGSLTAAAANGRFRVAIHLPARPAATLPQATDDSWAHASHAGHASADR